jgi:acyl-CoA thioester hydrolase
MIKESIIIRVRYSETDQMGFVYYGNYAAYLELGRVEAMKKIGLSYREMEERGIAMPVRDMNIVYRKAAKYDDEIRVDCEIREMPKTKMIFHYKIYRDDDLLIKASTTLLFMKMKSRKLCFAPQFLLTKMEDFFN